MAKTALITGITGQDGAHLAQLLLEKNYRVHGLVRWDSYADPLDGLGRLDTLGLVSDEITLHMGDVTDANNVNTIIKDVQPDEIYNLAGLSQVRVSFDTPASTLQINTAGVLNILDAVRVLDLKDRTRIYQASSSEMFGSTAPPQNEQTPMTPQSPYAVAKLAAYHLTRTYRDAYGLFACNGILFNHESPLRGEDFVTRKITKAVAEIEAGRSAPLRLGNLESKRDWGDARDYVEGMWLMLQQERADDYVLATGESHSVREFVTRAFAQIGVKIEWRGSGAEETGVDSKTGKTLVEVDPALFRPLEVNALLGDPSKARETLGWTPNTTFDGLISHMIKADRKALKQDNVSWKQAV